MNNEIKKNLINNEILTLANGLVDNIFNIESYSFCEVAENQTHDSAEYKDYGFESGNDFQDSDSFYKEVYEYYIVTPWIAEELKKVGGVIAYFDKCDFYIWGRTETGQSLTMDSDIEKVLNNIKEDS